MGFISNEESLFNGTPFNRRVGSSYGGMFGTFVICGLSETGFCSLTPAQIQKYKQQFYHAEALIGFRGEKPVILPTATKIKGEPRKKIKRKKKRRPTPGHDR